MFENGGDVDALQRAIGDFVRAFGLLQPESTPCGLEFHVSVAHVLSDLAEHGPITQQDRVSDASVDFSKRCPTDRGPTRLPRWNYSPRPHERRTQRKPDHELTPCPGGGEHTCVRVVRRHLRRSGSMSAFDDRAAEVMPFDFDAAARRFVKDASGGTESVVALDANDDNEIQLIREHLSAEAVAFAQGDFSDPARIHGMDMPGLDVLIDGADDIVVTYSEPRRRRTDQLSDCRT